MIAIILAGGSGTRFWPLSRQDHPKQLLNLWGERAMIGETAERLAGYTSREKILVISGPHLAAAIREALPEIPADNQIIEPEPRNTAPAIALAAAWAAHRFGDEVVGVFPSDHYIGRVRAFYRSLEVAEGSAQEGGIVTLGLAPTRPETGYGYIQCAQPPDEDLRPLPVARFVEKPNIETALEYLASGDYLWNSGMFFFRPSVLFDEIKTHLPALHEHLTAIRQALGTPQQDQVVHERFAQMEKISIDYGVMEKATWVKVVSASFAWSDVGHWAAISEVSPSDEANNVILGRVITHDTSETVIYNTTERIIAVAGLDKLVIVDTPDALLVLPKERAQDVRILVEKLRLMGHDEVL